MSVFIHVGKCCVLSAQISSLAAYTAVLVAVLALNRDPGTAAAAAGERYSLISNDLLIAIIRI
jgi:hypothetical protein